MSTGALVQVLSGASYGFNDPVAISSDGTYVWVANAGNNSVTELSASTGALVQVLSGSSYGFNQPVAISLDGTHVWVANIGCSACIPSVPPSVTELSASTGALTQVLASSSYGFNQPSAISSDGMDVWVANTGSTYSTAGDSVTELSASTGALVQVVSGDGLDYPDGIFSDGTHVWISNHGDSLTDLGSVTELSASTGALVQVISGSSAGFNFPAGISSDGTHVWFEALNPPYDGTGSVGELSASSGALVQVIAGSSYDFGSYPDAISSDSTHVWAVDSDGFSGPTVTELSSCTGGLLVTVLPTGATSCTPTTTTIPTPTTTATTMPTPTTSTTGTTLPARIAKPSLVAALRRVLAVTGGTRLTLACMGAGGTCKITAIMSVVETLRGGKLIGLAARARTVIVGAAHILTAAGGGEHTFLVKLDAVGASLLRTHGRLSVHLRVSSGPSVLDNQTVTIRESATNRR